MIPVVGMSSSGSFMTQTSAKLPKSLVFGLERMALRREEDDKAKMEKEKRKNEVEFQSCHGKALKEKKKKAGATRDQDALFPIGRCPIIDKKPRPRGSDWPIRLRETGIEMVM